MASCRQAKQQGINWRTRVDQVLWLGQLGHNKAKYTCDHITGWGLQIILHPIVDIENKFMPPPWFFLQRWSSDTQINTNTRNWWVNKVASTHANLVKTLNTDRPFFVDKCTCKYMIAMTT